jgi:hypothetical protein
MPLAPLLHTQVWLHFDRADTYLSGGASASCDGSTASSSAAPADGKEDDPNDGYGCDSGDSSPATAIDLDARDRQDAVDLLDSIMGRAASEPPSLAEGLDECNAGGDGEDELSSTVGQYLADFNRSLQNEAKERKFRFITKRLVSHHAAATGLAPDAAEHSLEKDDTVALSYLQAGKKVICFGLIEKMAVATGEHFSEERATEGPNPEAYLMGLAKAVVKQAHVDNKKALIICRWYQEVDRRGSVLSAYGNKGCAGSYLPLDNAGFPFVWTSNLLTITHVHMQPHGTIPRRYTLDAADKQVLRDLAKAKT